MKEILPKTYTRLEFCESFLSRQSKIIVVCFGLCEPSFVFQRIEEQINTVCKN